MADVSAYHAKNTRLQSNRTSCQIYSYVCQL